MKTQKTKVTIKTIGKTMYIALLCGIFCITGMCADWLGENGHWLIVIGGLFMPFVLGELGSKWFGGYQDVFDWLGIKDEEH